MPKLLLEWPDRKQGEMIPKGYGVAWRNYTTATTTLIPIPLNFLLAWIREVYFRLITGPRDRLEQQIIISLSEDEARGYSHGYQDGFKVGEKAAAKRAQILMEQFIQGTTAP